MSDDSFKRTVSFRWNSRLELYEFFQKKHGLDKKLIDNEIKRIMAQFHPRKGQVIRTQELWQKVGLVLESERKKADLSKES